MNVQELIDELMKVEDKTQICYSFNAEEELLEVESIYVDTKREYAYSSVNGVII